MDSDQISYPEPGLRYNWITGRPATGTSSWKDATVSLHPDFSLDITGMGLSISGWLTKDYSVPVYSSSVLSSGKVPGTIISYSVPTVDVDKTIASWTSYMWDSLKWEREQLHNEWMLRTSEGYSYGTYTYTGVKTEKVAFTQPGTRTSATWETTTSVSQVRTGWHNPVTGDTPSTIFMPDFASKPRWEDYRDQGWYQQTYQFMLPNLDFSWLNSINIKVDTAINGGY